MALKHKSLKFIFLLGALIDIAIAASWFAIAFGVPVPNILNGHIGTGPDYQIAMLIAAFFMLGWGILLAWGARTPFERRGLLLITAVFLLLSVVIEVVFFGSTLNGPGFQFGIGKRCIISGLFIYAYIYSTADD